MLLVYLNFFVARACFNENTGVTVAALRFFLGFDLHVKEDSDADSESDKDHDD